MSSNKAWMNAYTKGSKSLQDRLARVHAKNPEFQDFVKKHGLGSNLSVKQSGQQKKSTSIGSVKPVTDANPERGKLDRLAVIKAAAEKQRNRRLANSNRVAFGGELGGGFQMPGSGFRRYSESLEMNEVLRRKPGAIAALRRGSGQEKRRMSAAKQRVMDKDPEGFAAHQNRVKAAKALFKHVENLHRELSSPYAYERGAKREPIDNRKYNLLMKHINALKESALTGGREAGQPITVHTAHDIVNGQNEAWDESNYKWAEQSPEWKEKVKKDAEQRKSLPPKKSSFASGMKRAAEQLRKDRARKTDESTINELDKRTLQSYDAKAKNDLKSLVDRGDRWKNRLQAINRVKGLALSQKRLKDKNYGKKTNEEINFGDASYTMRRGGWVVKRNGKVASVILPTEKHAQDFINSTKMTLGRKVANVVRKKAKDIARGMGRISYATESAANRRRILSYDSAILPVEHEHPLTTPHPKAKLDALRAAGKHEEARELERKWLRKAMSKNKNSENSNEQ